MLVSQLTESTRLRKMLVQSASLNDASKCCSFSAIVTPAVSKLRRNGAGTGLRASSFCSWATLPDRTADANTGAKVNGFSGNIVRRRAGALRSAAQRRAGRHSAARNALRGGAAAEELRDAALDGAVPRLRARWVRSLAGGHTACLHRMAHVHASAPVSYTHLTLPTKRIV